MTHVLENAAENRYQKTVTVNRNENTECSICHQKRIPEKFGSRLHVRRSRNRYWFYGTGFGADFWYI